VSPYEEKRDYFSENSQDTPMPFIPGAEERRSRALGGSVWLDEQQAELVELRSTVQQQREE